MLTGIIGSGSMGRGIAQVLAAAGHEVLLVDHSLDALVSARRHLEKIMTRLIEKGRLSETDANVLLGRITYTETTEGLSEAALVIEAIVENLEVKQKVLGDLERVVSSSCILSTNTSSLSVSAIASALQEPERVIGLHFFNPAPLMKLVEVVPAIQTSEDVVNQSVTLMRDCGKTPVITKDTPGFIVNRVARPFYGEALRILEEGLADVATIDWAMTELGGFRMGPFTLMDYIGNDVNYTVTETVFKSFFYDPRYRPSFTQQRLSQAGYLGRKTGRGYYDYREGASQPEPVRDRERGQKILDRIVAMLINEAADAAYLNIATPQDLDLAMTLGVNYPKGLLKWADELGHDSVVSQLDFLYDLYREDRYRCSVRLRQGVPFFTT
jgi:3-hydroxybutyryl-CoA dehydrogenase